MISKIKNFLTLSFLIAIAGLATIIFTVTLIYPTLPDVENLSKYRPKEPLQIFTKDNYLIQEFGEERRDFIAIENVPQKMINAILAIEDRRFFEHPGIDLIGIIRAAVKNFTGQSREERALSPCKLLEISSCPLKKHSKEKLMKSFYH
jgi:penicillin-binding protein 1A